MYLKSTYSYINKYIYIIYTYILYIVHTFLQQLLLPQQLENMLETVALSDCVGEGGRDPEDGCGPPKFLAAPLNGRSISTNSRS